MTLDEIEKLARRVESFAVDGYMPPAQAFDLARAVLAMLPVVRAAIKIGYEGVASHVHTWGCGNSRPCDGCEFVEALDQINTRLTGGKP